MKTIKPNILKKWDRVCLVSPASTPTQESVNHTKKILESWWLKVEIWKHVFDTHWYLAGIDEDRLSDFNTALRDREIKAIIATRGWKWAYRIADKLDFKVAKLNPKLIIGFSEISILHLSLYKNIKLIWIHGAPYNTWSWLPEAEPIYNVIMWKSDIIVESNSIESTSSLTTRWKAEWILLWWNLDMISTSAGWCLPNLNNCILFIEAIWMWLGQVDRQLTMLINSGYLEWVKAVAIGQFTNFNTHPSGYSIIDVLNDRLWKLNIPILWWLPIGHWKKPISIPIGTMAYLDADNKRLTIESWVK